MSRDPEYIKQYILNCRREAEEAKRERMQLNKDNYDMYHLRHDFSHKEEGQSKEVLAKLKMAVENTRSFFQQALADIGEWWRCVPTDGTSGETMLIRPEEIFKMTNYQLKRAKYFSHVGNDVQSACLGSLGISKTYGHLTPKPKYYVKKQGRGKSHKKTLVMSEDKTWKLCFDTIRQENYFPDPTGAGLYEIVEYYPDFHLVRQMADAEDARYSKSAVNDLSPWTGDANMQEAKKARETGQNNPVSVFRPRIKLTEFRGTIVDDKTGEILHENIVCTLANDETMIEEPCENPLWHKKSDVVAAPLIEVANSVWHTALADAGTQHNRALIELYNLTLDAAMQAIHGVRQMRVDCLEDPSQVSKGVRPGVTLKVTGALPPGAKVVEQVITGDIPAEVLQFSNIIQQEFNSSMLTNDLRQGVMPFRQVKATEVVEASNTITSVFQGMAKNFEINKVQPELELSWMTTAQNWNYISKEEFVSLFGADRGAELHQLTPEEVFAATVNGIKFEVYGITLTLGKAADFRKLQMLLQTVAGSEVLIEEFLKKYSFEKFLGEIMTALDIDKKKIEIGRIEQAVNTAPPPGPPAQQGAANQMSQIPQAGGGGLADILGAPSFPGGPGTSGQGGIQ